MRVNKILIGDTELSCDGTYVEIKDNDWFANLKFNEDLDKYLDKLTSSTIVKFYFDDSTFATQTYCAFRKVGNNKYQVNI